MALGWVQKGDLTGPQGPAGAPGKSMRVASVDVGSNTDVAKSAISPNADIAVDDVIVDAKGEIYTVTAVAGDTVHVSAVVQGINLMGPKGPQGPKGDPGEGADVPVASSTVAGKVKAGSDFDVADDGTLSLYKAIALSYLNGGSQNELGSTVDNVTLTWDWNKAPTALTLDGTDVAKGEDGAFPKSMALTKQGLTKNRTYTLVATDARGAKSTKTATVSFLNRVYFGVGAAGADAVDSAFILGLKDSALASTRARTFTETAAAGEYIFYAIPAAMGAPKFTVGGFEGGFSKLKTLDHTNASGHTESYDVWRSDNAGLGATTVVVS